MSRKKHNVSGSASGRVVPVNLFNAFNPGNQDPDIVRDLEDQDRVLARQPLSPRTGRTQHIGRADVPDPNDFEKELIDRLDQRAKGSEKVLEEGAVPKEPNLFSKELLITKGFAVMSNTSGDSDGAPAELVVRSADGRASEEQTMIATLIAGAEEGVDLQLQKARGGKWQWK